MNAAQRLQNLLEGKPTDRPLYSAWGHVMNFCDRNARDFAKATIDFQNANGFDFVKIMSNPYYLIEDTGLHIPPVRDYATPVCRSCDVLPVQCATDWKKIRLPHAGEGTLAREREAISRVVDYYNGTVPVIATIFTPIMWLQYLCLRSDDMALAVRKRGSFTPLLEEYLAENAAFVEPILAELAERNTEYMLDLLDVGVTGFFYCSEHINGFWSDRGAFDRWERQYDIATLFAVRTRSRFNILHICGKKRLCPEWTLDYPVDAFNWDDREPDNPTMSEMRALTDKILIGGLDRRNDLCGDSREEIKKRLKARIDDALRASGTRTILSGGCDWALADTYRFYIWKEIMDEMVTPSLL